MLGSKTIICVIPARLDSTRFPRKMLADLGGKPLIQRTYEQASQIPFFDELVIAVDGTELFETVTAFGGKALLTSPDCVNGTERLIELKKSGQLEGDVWVNWQGDEPFLTKAALRDLLQTCENPDEMIWSLKSQIKDPEEVSSPNVVKVVTDSRGNALYFSRSPIPYNLDQATTSNVFKHIGLYAFSTKALDAMAHLPAAEIELAEKLEQLRFLYHGLPIRVHETTQTFFGIDTPEELLLAQTF